ncbi:MAG: Holliday junction DNA helicase RuvA [Candidatus Wildermuthbacteria bacterium RIFCSPHIGHO2_02_FULL_47_12]|uniref:Holliday junction branch migration complex subunit RuvA n=1 Tax=Candidatus Wildermuthbacteria bacterium RIFCSPHIGHO2_02_FULL_47_12 TaxID=1802451 RepID=A0A1G2R3R2_9BACT|nr:MAG: Holliday junction DNA helicase RuvA [Candidatus Wildermuthbacteria bacterium RIFCSPHIGHO2_02_FULL_47_12]
MISYIKGTVIAQGSDYIITNTGGIGYKVFLAANCVDSFSVGKEVEVYCHLHIRQDETLELYGVESLEMLELFETLKGISGIGPKAALRLSSLGSREQMREAIEKGDATFFAGVHGIGQKKIQKVILELTGKLKILHQGNEDQGDTDAIDALVALGFSRQKAKEALLKIPAGLDSLQKKVKEALKIAKR